MQTVRYFWRFGFLKPLRDLPSFVNRTGTSVNESLLRLSPIQSAFTSTKRWLFVLTLRQALGSSSPLVSREAARALGNLAANLEHGDATLKEGALNIFMALIRSEDHPVQRMAAMALCNLSSNVSALVDERKEITCVTVLIFNFTTRSSSEAARATCFWRILSSIVRAWLCAFFFCWGKGELVYLSAAA